MTAYRSTLRVEAVQWTGANEEAIDQLTAPRQADFTRSGGTLVVRPRLGSVVAVARGDWLVYSPGADRWRSFADSDFHGMFEPA